MSEPACKVRQQVLAMDALLDVFSYVDRRTLDAANIVSRAYNTAAQRASPLRIVKDAYFYHNPEDQTFHMLVYYSLETKEGVKKQRKTLRMFTDSMEEATVIFFRFLRFCNVSHGIRLYRLEIQQLFVDELKTVAKEFVCKDHKLRFNDLTFANGINALDILLALPSFRELNNSTYNLLGESAGGGDGLLKAVASRGAFYLFTEWPLYDRFLSEAAILDYTFGGHNDEGRVRKLKLIHPTVSKNLLINLVQACRECRSELKIDLKISILWDLDVDELERNGEKHPSDSGASYVWRFSFDDLPELNIEYKPRYRPQPPTDENWESAELRCWGAICGSAKGL